MTISSNDLPELITAAVATVALIVSFGVAFRQEVLATRQLRIQRDSDLLVWGHEAVDAMQQMILFTECRKFNSRAEVDQIERLSILSRCSSLIDRGRWFLPNIKDKAGKFGEEKQLAYRGFRQIGLDAMVYSYNQFRIHGESCGKSDHELIDFLTTAKRELVSEIQFTVSPQRIQKILGDKPNYPKWMHDK
jgi:hypothetical protein